MQQHHPLTLNGGVHSGNALAFQGELPIVIGVEVADMFVLVEFMLLPVGAKNLWRQ